MNRLMPARVTASNPSLPGYIHGYINPHADVERSWSPMG